MDSRVSRYSLRSRDIFEEARNGSFDHKYAKPSFDAERSQEIEENRANAWVQEQREFELAASNQRIKKVTFGTTSKSSTSSNHRRIATVKAFSHNESSLSGSSGSSGSSDYSDGSPVGSIVGILKRSANNVPAKPVVEDGSDRESSTDIASSRCSTPEERVAFAREMVAKDETVKRRFEFYQQNGEWWDTLPKTDYTYSRLSRHRQEVSPGVIALPNMSRPRVSSHGSRQSTFSSSSSTSPKSPPLTQSTADTVDYQRFSRLSRSQSNVQTSTFARFLNVIWLFLSTSFSSVSKYWSDRSSASAFVYELRTPPRHTHQESLFHHLSSSLYRVVSSIYRFLLHILFLDTWLLSHLRFGRGTTPRVVTLWPLLMLLLILAGMSRVGVLDTGWSLGGTQLFPTVLIAPMDYMISGVKTLSESAYSVLPTVPFAYILNVFLNILFAPWNMMVALWSWVCSLGSILVSLLTFLFVASSEGSPDGVSSKVPLVMENFENIGINRESTPVSSMDFEKVLLAEIAKLRKGDEELKAEILRLSRDFEELKSSQNPSEELRLDLENLKKLMIAKEESMQQLIGGVQQKFKLQIDGVRDEVNTKVDADQVDRKLERIRTEQGVLFAELNEVKSGLKIALDKTHLYSKLAGDGRDTLRKLMLLQMQFDGLRKHVDNCCGKLASGQLNEDIKLEMMHVLHTLTPSAYDDSDLRAWIKSVFVSKNDVDLALAKVTETFNEELKRRESVLLEASASEISARIAKYEYEHRATLDSTWRNNGSLDEWQIRRIVENVLTIYDADKTGMSDFALESQGGEVISTRCTEQYQKNAPSLSLLGVPLWYPSNSPRTVIQPGMHPGDCWAFAGSQGYLVVRLSHTIYVKGFSYEHVPAALLPTGRIDSAPKNFSVWGLKEELDKDPVHLGSYQYMENGTSLQYFSVQTPDVPLLQLIELHITSNHGNINYTCLYRFRVHGKIA